MTRRWRLVTLAFVKEIAARVREDGPVDMYLTEEEYGELKLWMRRLWRHSFWSWDEKLCVLAFFRGYTFYRELSEDENRFWGSFHEELELDDVPLTNTQYDLLWAAFEAHPVTNELKVRSAYRREFVRTIDEVWGIRSLHSSQLVRFFISYYREHPGKRITAELMQRILGWVEDAVLRQAASFDRVFTSMTHAIDVILEDELEALPLEQLEEAVRMRGVDLGRPNALRYFTNKRAHAVPEIIGELRQQRTPAQFARYLNTIPRHTITLPSGARYNAQSLTASQDMPYGRYADRTTGEEHHVTPAARISLSILERLPLKTFKKVAGIILYAAEHAFTAQVGNRVESSMPLYARSGVRHLWFGTPQHGVPLTVDGVVHPDTVGINAQTLTRLVLHEDNPYLQGEINIDAFLPNRDHDLTLQIGTETYSVTPQAQGQSFVFRVPSGGIEAHLEEHASWSWHSDARLFTSNGVEIARKRLRYGPKTLYFVSSYTPAVTGPANVERLSGRLPLWQIMWDGSAPLEVDDWRIDAPYPAVRWVRSPRARRAREDVEVQLHEGYFAHDEIISIPTDDVPAGTRLRLGSHVFTPHAHGFRVTGLPPGRYAGEFVLNGEVVGELEPFRVLPPLDWDLAHETLLVQGRTQGARVTLPDGRFTPFRWKPLQTSDGEPKLVPITLELDDGSDLVFDLKATCVSAQFVNPKTQKPLDVLRSLSAQNVALRTHNPYSRDLDMQVRLASQPERVFTPEALPSLQPAARDTLIVELCQDKRSQNWVPLMSVPVRIKPVVSAFRVLDGVCTARVRGPHDVTVHLEEFDPHSGRSFARDLDVHEDGRIIAKLQHPQKLRSLLIRLKVSSSSVPDEVVQVEEVSPPLLNFRANLPRGIAWSRRGLVLSN